MLTWGGEAWVRECDDIEWYQNHCQGHQYGKALLTIPALEGHLRTFFGEGEVLSALIQPECL